MRQLYLFLCLLCSGCHTLQKHALPEKDGLPQKIPATFKQFTPKAQPLSRYGNPASYSVQGKTYKVLRSAHGYKTQGIASWYGTKFHKQRTSSGDPYDMFALTAAHRTLPLPTYVRVKNVTNGKQAIVKVNDRGPFHDDRVIDLSYAAASTLGLLPTGTAKVEIEAIELKSLPHAQYYLQAGAFQSEEFANSLKNKLRTITSSPVIIEKSQTKFLVKVGPFEQKQSIATLQEKLVPLGIHSTFALLK